MGPKPKKLLDQVRNKLRVRNYSYATEKSYLAWIRRYILLHNKRHPATMGRPKVEAFLTNLAVKGHVAPPQPLPRQLSLPTIRHVPPSSIIRPAISFTIFAATVAVKPATSWRGLNSTTSAPTTSPPQS